MTDAFDAMLRAELERRLKVCAARFAGRKNTVHLRRQIQAAFSQERREFEGKIVSDLGTA